MKYFEFKSKLAPIKYFQESSHLDRALMKNIETGELYLYEFYEYVDYNGGNDEIYETFTKVKDEKDAEELNKLGDIRRTPYIRIMPDYSFMEG